MVRVKDLHNEATRKWEPLLLLSPILLAVV
jgi:hypothetical protein